MISLIVITIIIFSSFLFSFIILCAGTTSRTLSWWCFNPGLAMQEFEKLGVRSIILTSGTLSPLDSFALELNL